ncbi:MAG: YraN family protein [Psychrobacter sp.]|nr:YraN family protein [Psychrobacter sp.]
MTDNKTNTSHSNLIYLTDSERSANIVSVNAETDLDTVKLSTTKTNVAHANKSKSHKSRSPLLATSPTQLQGSYFEQLACDYLQQQGLQLIAKNWQQPKVGELDLVMIEVGVAWSTLVFVEVRQRQRSSFGDAALSVTASKQRKIIKAAQYFLQQYPEYANYDCRFDVIAYNINKIDVNKADITKAKLENNNAKPASCRLTKSNVIKPSMIQPSCQPEWLQGAFVAQAW